MTTRGEPKLVDFGLAKRLDATARVQTQTGTVLGTPSYMSPEQAAGQSQIGPASDLFSIGVILYQLLTGRLPFDSSSAVETLKLIAERDPANPSKHRSSVPRDLETICLKCLAKNPVQRYASARELSEDLARFLDHRPIQARRSGMWERAVRTIKRHREASALAASLGLLLLTALSYALWQRESLRQVQQQADSQTRMATEQRQRANKAELAYESSLQQARELVGRTTDLGLKLANQPGWDETRRKAFEDAASYYEEFLKQHADDPTIRREAAEAAMRSASIHTELGRWTESEARLKNADQWLGEMNYDRQAQWLRTDCLLQLAIVNWRLERPSQSEKIFKQAMALMRSLLADNPDRPSFLLRLANAQTNYCALIHTQRRFDECIATHLDAIDNCVYAVRSILEMDPLTPRDPKQSIEQQLSQRLAEAKDLRLQVLNDPKLKSRGSQVTDAFAELALTLDDLSGVLASQQLASSAEEALRESVALRRAVTVLVPNNRHIEHYVARGLSNLGSMLLNNNKVAEAQPLIIEAEQLFRALARDFPDRIHHKREWAFALNYLARSYSMQQKHAQAIQFADQAVKIHEQLAASQPGHEGMRRDLIFSLKRLASCYQAMQDREQALAQYQRMLELLPDDAAAGNSFAWAVALPQQTNATDIRRAVELSRRTTEIAANNSNYFNTYALVLYRAARCCEDRDEAQSYFQDALKAIVRAEELASGGTIGDWFFHSLILSGLQQYDEARQWHDRAETRRLAQSPADVELQQFSQESIAALNASRRLP